MSEDQAAYDVETLKDIAIGDQQSKATKDADLAIARGRAHTAAHYKFLTASGLPAHLVEQLTTEFHAAYFGALLYPDPSYSVTIVGDDE